MLLCQVCWWQVQKGRALASPVIFRMEVMIKALAVLLPLRFLTKIVQNVPFSLEDFSSLLKE